MAQLGDLMIGNGASAGGVRDVPIAERMQMTALDVLRHAMHRNLAVNNWERAAHWAVYVAEYEDRKLAPIVPATDDYEQEQQDCRCN